MLGTDGLDAAEHCIGGFHFGQDVSSLQFELLNLAALVNILGIGETRSKSDVYQLVCFTGVVVGVYCSFKISISNQ